MGITLVGWSENVAAAVVRQDLLAIPDNHVRTEADNIVIPQYNQIVGEYAIGVDIRNVQLDSPSLRTTYLEGIAPVENTALPVFPPDPLIRKNTPLPVVTDEQLRAAAGNSNIGAQQESVFVWLSDGVITPLTGKVFTLLHTATAPATAFLWASADLAASQSLPVGTYQVVGGRCEQANTIAWRLIFIGGVWRPGTIATGGIATKEVKGARYGAMGEWGKFDHLTPPRIEFFGDGTGGAAQVYLDMIKVA